MNRADDDEAQILLAVQSTLRGEPSAFSIVVHSYTDGLYRLARNYGRSAEDADEDVQEIFLRAYQSLSGFDISRRFRPWLYQIAVNHLKSARRKRVRRLSRAKVVVVDQQDLDAGTAGTYPDPEQEVLDALADEEVRRALDSLPGSLRDAFVLRQMQGMPGPEAARALGIPEPTLRTHLRRARAAIARFVSERGWV